jgi:hypothetical protein
MLLVLYYCHSWVSMGPARGPVSVTQSLVIAGKINLLRFEVLYLDSDFRGPESRLNTVPGKSLEVQMVKDLRRENEEERRRLDPRGWEGGTPWESSDGEKSEFLQKSESFIVFRTSS